MPGIPFMPPQASTMAWRVDAIFFTLSGLAAFFTLLVFVLVIYFAVKYRRKSENEVPEAIHGDTRLELAWTFIPLGLALAMFAWSGIEYININNPPANAMEIYVIGRQWMWKVIHPDGQEEINQLHVPLGRPVRLTMTSQDVIHSFFIPAFRVKQDTVPGRYQTMWFEPTEVGEFHIFCAEYCGTQHSGMIGTIYVMEPSAYEQWLASGGRAPAPGQGAPGQGAAQISPAQAGELQFATLGCAACHRPEGGGPGPSLVGIYNTDVKLEGGQTVKADDNYLRESILAPGAKIVAGYQNLMPSFQGRVSNEQLDQLLAYIKGQAQPAAPSGSGR